VIFLLWLGQRFVGRLKSGDLILIYMLNYAIERFLLDSLRLDASPKWAVSTSSRLPW
jgi:prolipoprotein diacylglyceryltransferase